MLTIAWFEFRTKLKRISTYVYFSIFAALATLWMAAAGGAFASANVVFDSDKVFINSPFALAQTITVLGLFGVVVVAAFMGRFLGAVAILVFIFLGIAFGILVGTHWPGVDAARLGPWSLAAFAQPY
ncbi:MAG TPA: hypothetical protein VF287_03955, partial [Usitatibacter sp.]